jgi:hypothetical protein
MGTPKGRDAGSKYLTRFIEEMKACGFVASGLARSGQHEAVVAPRVIDAQGRFEHRRDRPWAWSSRRGCRLVRESGGEPPPFVSRRQCEKLTADAAAKEKAEDVGSRFRLRERLFQTQQRLLMSLDQLVYPRVQSTERLVVGGESEYVVGNPEPDRCERLEPVGERVRRRDLDGLPGNGRRSERIDQGRSRPHLMLCHIER